MPFIYDAWYAAGWGRSLGQAPLSRLMLGEPIVLFRTESGRVAALQDRCPHRAVPLHMGSVSGEHIQCLYHGLQFNAAGRCVHNPHVKREPGLSTPPIKNYAVAERHGMIWVWMGRPESANEKSIPDYSWFADDDRYAVSYGNTYVKGGYELIIDNLLDLSHAEYLHANTVGTVGSSGTVATGVEAGDDWVKVKRKVFGLKPSRIFAPHWSRSELIDQRSDMLWRAPSNLLLDIRLCEAGDETESGLHFPSAHLLTPETERTSHYFWAVARDFKQGDDVLTQNIRTAFEATFGNEDRPVVEAIQQAYDLAAGKVELCGFTMGDAGSAKARRILERLAGQSAAALET